MNFNIAVIKGDGIGPEIVTEAMKVMDKAAEKFGHTFNYTPVLMFRSPMRPLRRVKLAMRFF